MPVPGYAASSLARPTAAKNEKFPPAVRQIEPGWRIAGCNQPGQGGIMASQTTRARDIFLDAVEIGSPGARAAFLDDACAGDGELRRRVEALIEAHERPESLLDRAAVAS